jgi:hypothetical protein
MNFELLVDFIDGPEIVVRVYLKLKFSISKDIYV